MTDEEKARELTIKNVTDGKNKYFSWGFYKGCVVGLEYNNKQIAELEEKISVLLSCKNCSENKGGWICAKEYENKCLTQKIEFIKELEEEKCELLGIIQGKDKVIQELKKENAELKSKNCWKTCEYAEPKSHWISQHIQDVVQLTKAKEIIKDFILMAKVEHLKDRYETVDEAEQFLNSEVE